MVVLFLQLRGWILLVKVGGLWGWVLEATSFWVTGQKSGLQLLVVPVLVGVFVCVCVCRTIMKKATLCHCRPCRVQPGQAARAVWSLYLYIREQGTWRTCYFVQPRAAWHT